MKPPLVSIIINNYNYQAYVGRAIQSALNQTYRPIEIIVVDDGSSDESREVIEQYRSGIRTVFKENGGQASAFNAGFAIAKGELIQFLDSDDMIDEDCVEHLVAQWDSDHSSIQFRLRFIDAEDRVILLGRTMPGNVSQGKQLDNLLKYGNYHYTTTTGNLYARAFLEQALPIPEAEFRICADTYLQTVVPFTGRVKGVLTVHGSYRVHGANAYYAQSRTRHPRQLKSAIISSQLRAQLITQWAEKYSLTSAPRIGDREMTILSLRAIYLRLYPNDHPVVKDTRCRLLGLALLALPTSALQYGILTAIKLMSKTIIALVIPRSVLRRVLQAEK